MNEMIAKEKDINDELFSSYFKYQNPSLLAKDLITARYDKNETLVNKINDGLTDLRKAIVRKKIPENENPNKIVNII